MRVELPNDGELPASPSTHVDPIAKSIGQSLVSYYNDFERWSSSHFPEATSEPVPESATLVHITSLSTNVESAIGTFEQAPCGDAFLTSTCGHMRIQGSERLSEKSDAVLIVKDSGTDACNEDVLKAPMNRSLCAVDSPNPAEPPAEAVKQPDGSFVLELQDGSTLRWTQRPNGTWRKPERKRSGWTGDLDRKKYEPPASRGGDRAISPSYDRSSATTVVRDRGPLVFTGIDMDALGRRSGKCPW